MAKFDRDSFQKMMAELNVEDRVIVRSPLEDFADELADLLKITRSHAYRLKKSQNWPHHGYGKSIRFSIDDIQKIQAMNHKQPPPEPGRRAPRIPKRGELPRIPKRQ
ncbi:helix-turn-helix domain-containing protein [Paenarthrobacter aurescens]|jgi:hypothetical protein|uniref:helix-turn-helix domain-containing protein n=1 Tax=Paenarthrobacter aurescens TaxID=43663 RepID=UPI0005C20653|nr:helix-turn-helix domain-containing protein [Paenarthrobacter aurescens]